MEILHIFANRLYAIRYDDEQSDALESFFDAWQDAEYLENFFEEHQSDLQNGFFDPVPTIEQAVNLTRLEAKRLEIELKNKANSLSLEAIFKPLSDDEISINLSKQKAYGIENKSWLRIYAIRIGDRFIVTGGAIELTRTMKEREHTKEQIARMERCLSYFKEQGIHDIDGFKELDL